MVSSSAAQSAIAAQLIHGTGEMADRVRDCDWTKTPLGPIESWPETLLAMVNLVLSSELPMQVIWGPEMVSIYNDALRPAFNDKHPEALGHYASDIWAEVWSIVGPQLQAVLDDATPLELREVLLPLLNNGTTENQYWDYSYSPIRAADGRVLGILNMSKDVTAAVTARHQLQQIIAGTTDGMMLVNRKWEFDFFNERARSMAQISRDVTGENLWKVFPRLDFPDSPYVYHYHRAMFEGQQGEFFAEYGEPLNISLKLFVKPVETGMLVIFRDVTVEKQAQAALLQSEKLAAVGKLAGSIAHEINNPLESVTNLLYLAKHGEPADIQTYISLAERELRRVSVIANQTLRFYRQSTRPTRVTCSEVFGSVLSIFQGRLVNSRIEVQERKRALESFECFEGEIRQVLSNLVGNAVDAMPGEGGRLLLRSRNGKDWTTGRRGIVLTVADSGCGMSEHTRRKLFEAFYTTKGIGGTGLGLWVSQEIVDRHEGRLRVRSRQAEHPADPRHGSVFTLFLPFDAVIRAHEPAA